MIVTGQSNKRDDDTKKRSITIGLFLDGTLGNKYNTEARLEFEKKYGRKDKNKKYNVDKDNVKIKVYKKNDEDESSYSNAYSNVAKLYHAYIENKVENKYKFYVEGPGSIYFDDNVGEDRYRKDETFEGNGLGKGVNGIRGKMYKALRKAVSKIDDKVDRITVDVFGFSRGAAGASAIVDQKAYTCISGESGVIALDDLKDTSFSPKAMFDYISTMWSFGEKVKYVQIKMDKKETFDIYKRIYENDPTREVEVRIDVNKENNHVRVFFCQLGLEYPREIEVEKADIKIYPLSEGQYHWITVFKDRYETKYPYKLKKTK